MDSIHHEDEVTGLPPGRPVDASGAQVQNRLIWDFFGRSAEDVARHFLGHLRDFLQNNELTGKCRPSLQSETAWHWFVVCDFEEATHAKAVARVLKPSSRSHVEGNPAEPSLSPSQRDPLSI